MRQDLLRGARLLSAAVVVCSVAVSASAQTSMGAQPPAAAASEQASGPVRRLSINDAVQLALEHNLDIQVQRLNPQIQDLNVALARTNWTPQLQSTFSNNSNLQPVSSVLAGGQNSVSSSQFGTNVGVSQLLPWGGNYNIAWDSQRSTTDSIFQSVNPVLQSTLSMTYTQPLLRNFGIDATRDELLVSRKNREISDAQLRQTVVQTVRNVKDAYWNLSYAISSLKVQEESLDLAKQSLQDNEKRVQIGTMAPIDIVEAQAEMASREEAVIVAQAAIKQAEDQLRTQILDPTTPDFWHIDLIPTDSPTFRTQPVDVDAAVRNALAKRTDIEQAQKSLEANGINIRYFRNQLLPAVNAQVNYGMVGLGGTEFIRGPGLPGPIIGQVNQSFGSVLSELLHSNYPTWTVGVQLDYPLGRSAAQASLAQARLQDEQAKVELKNLELQVAAQVRDAARQVNTNIQRVASARAAEVLSKEKLDAEQKKFTAGMSTNFQVFQAQRDLASARNDEIQAILDYNKSVVDFESVQQAALAGNGGSIVIAGPLTGTSGTSFGSTTGTTTGTTSGGVQ